jgi:cephalosporin hydroxylase
MPEQNPYPKWLVFCVHTALRIQHGLADLVTLRRYKVPAAGLQELNEIVERSRIRTDISEHLPTLFVEAVRSRPELIVELGVRGGESTFALERAARRCGEIPIVSVDIEDCESVSHYSNRTFVKMDDIAFARQFPSWRAERNLPDRIGFLFIDTSHLYEHTVEEIKHWFPLLAPRATVCFHDTNMWWLNMRRDWTLGTGWSNKRGVIRAIEEYLGTRYNEKAQFADYRKGWLVQHYPNCSGLTILSRNPDWTFE